MRTQVSPNTYVNKKKLGNRYIASL
jgi:hypothetical protein